VDIELKPLGTATVKGTVEGKGAELAYLARDGDRMGASVFVRDGRFEFTGVEAGRYRLFVQPGEYGKSIEVEVADGETREVTVK
jgi:hypothetical protein